MTAPDIKLAHAASSEIFELPSDGTCFFLTSLAELTRLLWISEEGDGVLLRDISRSNSTRVGPRVCPILVGPVILPPGRLKLATRPQSLPGSRRANHNGNDTTADTFAALAAFTLMVAITTTRFLASPPPTPAAGRISVCKSVLERDVLPFDKTGFFHAFLNLADGVPAADTRSAARQPASASPAPRAARRRAAESVMNERRSR